MKKSYYPQEIEKNGKNIGMIIKFLKQKTITESLNITHCRCFHTRQGNFTWDMSETTQLQTL